MIESVCLLLAHHRAELPGQGDEIGKFGGTGN